VSYKAVALFDLDKTLLNPEKQIPPENLAALKALKDNHVLTVLSTGRNYYELADWMRLGQIPSAIAANGADVYHNGQHLFESPVGLPQLQRLTQQAKPMVWHSLIITAAAPPFRKTPQKLRPIINGCAKPHHQSMRNSSIMMMSACY
jgi:HAD superfamily hydrolase (TIGR01484 family)